MNDSTKNIISDMKKDGKDHEEASLSVEEVLNLPALNGYKLLAGDNGLYKRCKHITALETPTGMSWLEGEEFLITTGYAFVNNEQYKKTILIDAHSKGVSAIAIKENRYFGDISQELIEQANRFEIPLIQLPHNVAYTSIISSFYDMLFYRKNEYILRLNDIYEKLMNLSFENRDIEDIIYTLSNLSNSNVFLYDDSLNLICFNIINPSNFDRLSPVNPFNKKGVNLINQIKNRTINKKLSDSFISFYPISISNENVAYMYIINDNKLDKLSQRSIEHGVSIITAKLEQDHKAIFAQKRAKKTLVEIMLNNDELHDEFYHNVELNLNWDGRGFIYGICIKLHAEKDKKVENYKLIIYNYLDNIIGKNKYLYTSKNNYIFVFIKVPVKDDLKGLIFNLMEHLKTYEDILTISIGISKPYGSIKSIRRLYDEAYLAILSSNRNIVYYDSLDTIKLLYPLKDYEGIQRYYDRTINKLEEYDKENGTELLQTLETYFKYNLKKTLVADKLFIHVETLRYRLNRIEEITGYSVEESEGLFAMQMGLKIKKLLNVK